MKKFILISFCFFVSVTELYSVDKIYLNDGWELRRVGDSVWYPATVPGTVHTDLYNNGLIPDPFYRDNEKKLQWIENEDWEYKCEFNISDSVFNKSNIDMTFEGLDTYAMVYLNDSLIITADDMFRTWVAECKRLIRKGNNTIYIIFESPIKKAKELKSGPELPGGDRVYTRKAAYQYGWDFGPRFVTSGIWKNVYLNIWGTSRIESLYYRAYQINSDLAKFNLNVYYQCDSAEGNYNFKVINENTGTLRAERKCNYNSKEYDGIRNLKNILAGEFFDIEIANPKLWWCNGMGDPYLYRFKVIMEKDGKFIDEKIIEIGLKKIELVQEDDSTGQSFYFKLNNIPIFIKGANWIPPDNFIPNISNKKYNKLIDDAIKSNINMIRVWGGGIYENEEFYNLCDERGILVWQDHMFANTMYPIDDSFMMNVLTESLRIHNILKNHVCLALYCGNNEIEEGWNNWGWQNEYKYSKKDSVRLWKGYIEIFNFTTGNAEFKNVEGIPYIPTSPKIGWGHPEAMKEGDSHYWGVWWGMEPFEMFEKKIPRFMSEYGFQAFPDMKTIEQFTLPEDRYLYSPVMKAHQKHPTGYETIQTYMEREYKQPKDFESYVYVSQLLQAYGIKRAIEAHRRAKPYCMGTMYWQFDDCWPGVTWSGIDYYGRWKAMQYFVKEAYNDILVSVHEENDSVKVYVVSDRLQKTKGNLQMSLMDFEGTSLSSKTPLPPFRKGGIEDSTFRKGGIEDSTFRKEGIEDSAFRKGGIEVIIPPNSSEVYFAISKKDLILGHSLNDVVLSVKFTDDEGKEYKNLYYFVPPKELALENPEINYDLDVINGDLILFTKKLAKNVHITIDDVSAPLNLENNYFDMLPGETVKLKIGNNIHKSRIKVTSLYDTY